jgi:chaperonin GroES
VNLQPISDRIVVKPSDAAEKTPGGIYIPSTAKEKPQLGTVVAIGSGRIDNGVKVAMECAVGDTVLYGKYSGSEITVDSVEYIIMRESDVLAIQKNAAQE